MRALALFTGEIVPALPPVAAGSIGLSLAAGALGTAVAGAPAAAASGTGVARSSQAINSVHSATTLLRPEPAVAGLPWLNLTIGGVCMSADCPGARCPSDASARIFRLKVWRKPRSKHGEQRKCRTTEH
jgi:hypothetical protein